MSFQFHAFGREKLTNAWIELFGEAPQLHEIQIVQAVALGEGGYGQAKYKNQVTGETAVINNWGATQCGHGPPCGPNCFEVTDHHADGSAFNWCYHRFATPEEGARSYLKILLLNRPGVRATLPQASTDAFVRAMKESRYFELRLDKYQDNVWNNVNKIATELGEPLAVHREEGGAVLAESPLPKCSSERPPDTARSGSQSTSPQNCEGDDPLLPKDYC